MGLHIVQISPPWYPVPPQGYGGIELVMALLVDELRRRGHRLTLFGAEGSQPGTLTLAPEAWGGDLGRPNERLREMTYASRVLQAIVELGPIDVIHDHTGATTLVGASALGLAPVVHTVHGSIHEPERTFYQAILERVGLVAISRSQRSSAPELDWLATVHNAVDTRSLRVGSREEKEPYLLCLARICPDKGQHLAIEVAQRTGYRLVLAGKIEQTPTALAYYHRHVAPAIDGDKVIHLHNVAGQKKANLLARTTALLAPIQWEEPFGLAIVEAMASGTPAIAMARGAAPELIEEGVSGFLARNVDEMVAAVRIVGQLDPFRCAANTRMRFSPAAMADGYLDVYWRAGTVGAVAIPHAVATLGPGRQAALLTSTALEAS